MKQIPLGGKNGIGKCALIDDDLYDELNGYGWWLHHMGYVTAKKDGRSIYLHRLVNKTPLGYETDHINHDKLDCRRENLRTCTHMENNQNTKVRKDNTSGVTGVKKYKDRWHVLVQRDYKRKFIGVFYSFEEAVEARRAYCSQSNALASSRIRSMLD